MGSDYKRTEYGQFDGGSNTFLATDGTDEFILPGDVEAAGAVEVDRITVIAHNCIVDRARLRLTVTPGAGATRTFTLRLNGAPTAIVITIANPDVWGQDLVNAVQLAEQDEISWLSDGGVNVPAASRMHCALRSRSI